MEFDIVKTPCTGYKTVKRKYIILESKYQTYTEAKYGQTDIEVTKKLNLPLYRSYQKIKSSSLSKLPKS